MTTKLFTDGACLGNPGPMGLGIHLTIDTKVIDRSIPFGQGTNNIAEYSALIKGLELALEENTLELEVFLDSQLVVKQVNGQWRVKDVTLQQLHKKATALMREFDKISISHVRREFNTRADELSKIAAMQVSAA